MLAGCATVGGLRHGSAPTREVLPNGVVLIVQEHRASDVVALQLWMRIGGRDEVAAELGLAHYIEHMLFKGTPTRPPGSIDTLVEGFGGASNAFTSDDTTHYDFVVPAAHVRGGIELLADLAVNASFPPGEIENEKKVVFEEMNLIEDDPEKFLLRRLYELSYSPHPYGRPLLGRREFIQKLTRDQLAQFYRKHFVPKNMVLVVVGAVEPARVRLLADATFGRIAAAPPAPRADGQRGPLRGGSADVHPRRFTELASEPDRPRAAATRGEHRGRLRRVRAERARHRDSAARVGRPRTSRGGDPGRDPEGARRGRDGGRAAARPDHRGVELRVRYRDRRRAGEDLRTGGDDLDPRQRARVSLAAPWDHQRPDPGGRAEVLRRRQLRARKVRPRGHVAMIRWALVVLAVGIFGLPADAAAQATRERLDNGLTVLVREN